MQDFASNNGKDEDLEGKISLNYQNDIGKNLSLSSRKLHSGLPHNEVADLLQFRVFELSTEAKYHYMNKGEIEIINFSMCLDTKSDQNRVAKIQNNINYSTNTDANNAEERYSSDFLNFFKYVEKNPDSKEFKYLVRRNESLNPYDLKIVDYFEIDQKSSLGFYTVSAQVLTIF